MARSHHTLRGRVILRSVAVTAVFGCGIALATDRKPARQVRG